MQQQNQFQRTMSSSIITRFVILWLFWRMMYVSRVVSKLVVHFIREATTGEKV
jgi:hypothetical protein